MSEIVNDIDRPDVGGVLPKMQAICDKANEVLAGITPYLRIFTDDNLMSSITVKGTKEPQEQWAAGIFHNATYFILSIKPMDGKRYYDPADGKVTVELLSGWKMPKFRKYTGPVDKVLEKIKAWSQLPCT